MISDPPIDADLEAVVPTTTEVGETARSSGDCRTCDLRAKCISYGWMSPGGVWFESAVVLRPPSGCRGYIGRGADIKRHFSDRRES